MSNLRRIFENIPYWLINLLTILSGIITIFTPIAGFITLLRREQSEQPVDINWLLLACTVAFLLLIILLVLRLWKYRKLSKSRLRTVSFALHSLSHKFRDVFFDILHDYKLGQLNETSLTNYVDRFIKESLNELCRIMEDYTGCEIFSCIKLIECDDSSQKAVDVDEAKIVVFCRSDNSDKERINYDKQPHQTYLKNDTALMQVAGPDAKPHFSCADLRKYREKHSGEKEYYKNPNQNWEKYYVGTFVVPIRIELRRLFYKSKKEKVPYHVIGFLCLDSLSKNAFLDKQEKYNAEIIKSFADVFYVVFSKYSHYLYKIRDAKNITKVVDSN